MIHTVIYLIQSLLESAAQNICYIALLGSYGPLACEARRRHNALSLVHDQNQYYLGPVISN